MNFSDYVEKRRQLISIKRFNMELITRKQNIAEHGYHVATMFYLLCKEMKIEPSVNSLFLVLNHDFNEVFTGDINRSLKEQDLETLDAWNLIEERLVPDKFKKFSDLGIVKELSNKEYIIFRIADAFEAYLYCIDEKLSGNNHIQKASKLYINIIKDLIEEAETIFKINIRDIIFKITL